MKTQAEHELAYDFSASVVDAASGIIRGVTVAKAGVQATGKFIHLDKDGKLTRDLEKSVKKLPVFTDDETLNTLLGAAQDAGGRVKSRSDHNDTLSSRAGYTKNFRREGDRVVADLHLNKSYKDRDMVLETSKETPELIGCSIEAPCTYVIQEGKALMRVTELLACDIVDEGAITPNGLFLSARVDTPEKEENPTNMASPTVEEFAALQKSVTELAAAVKAIVPAAPSTEVLSAVKDISEKFAAAQKAQADFITEQNAKLATLSKERQALGLSAERIKIVEQLADETEKARLAAEAAKGAKTYLSAVDEAVTQFKCSRSDAHVKVQRANPDLYAAHLKSKGAIK